MGGSAPSSIVKLRRYRPDGSEDLAFISPGAVRSVKALAGGKWLVEVETLLPLPGGRVLAGRNFATADERVDPTFLADERIEEWRSLAVNGDAIYVVTAEPVAYGSGFRTNHRP